VFNGTAVMQNVNVDGAEFTTNLAGPWSPAGGVWTSPTGKIEGRAPGDGFYLSSQSGSDFTYEGDVQLANGVAAALTFRANDDHTQHYTVNVDALAGVVKLWRPGRDIASYPADIVPGRTYHLKVVADGSHFRVHLDHGATPVIDATDDAYASGRFGLNVFNGIGVFDNVTVGAAQ
jgi:fructan beta-fructosidase